MPSFAIDVIVRAFILVSSAWCVAMLARKRSAAVRAGIWTVAFASLLALPAVARVTPAWRIAVLPALTSSPESVATATAPSARAEQPIFEGRSVGAGSRATVSSASSASSAPSVSSGSSVASASFGPAASGATVVAPTEARGERFVESLTPAQIAIGLWASVALLLLVRIGTNRLAAARLIRRASASCDGDAAWRADVDATRAELGLARPVGIRFTDAVAVPAVIGVWRPVLLLPPDAGEWTAEARRVVVLHELAHVARWDAFDQLASEIGCALYWIVPPVWIAARSAAALREQATDDAVIRAGVRPSTYAANLIDLAQNIASVEAGAASLAMAASRIQDRVAAILDPSVRRGRITLRGALILIFAAGLTVTTLAAVTPERQVMVPPPPPPPPPAPTPVPPVPPEPPAPMTPLEPPSPMPAPPPQAPMPALAPMAPPEPPSPMPALAPMAPPAPPAPMAAPAPLAPLVPPPPMPGPAPLPPPPVPPALGAISVSRSGTEPSALCPNGRDSFSNSSNSDGTRRTWSVKISGRGCTVDLRSDGKIAFNDDFTDVASITPSGYFRLDVERNDGRHELDIDGRGTSLTHTWRVDRTARAYDAAAQAWFGQFLIALDRETAVGVDVRLPKLLKQGGVDAVLKETALMTSDYARSRYYSALSRATKLSSSDVKRILDQAASLMTQDYYAAELLKALGPQVGDSASDRAALVGLLGTMKSDYYIVEGVNSVYSNRTTSASDVDFLVRLMPRLQSDYYKREMIKRIVSSGRVDAAQRGRLADVLASMHEDYYMAAVLADLMQAGGPDAGGRQAIIGAVSRIHGAYYASEAVRSIVSDTHLGESDLLRLVDVVKPIREDHYKSQALRAIARHGAATEKVRQAVIGAADGLSEFYRNDLLKIVRTR